MLSPASETKRLAAIRMRFGWCVVDHVPPFNSASSVRRPVDQFLVVDVGPDQELVPAGVAATA